MAISENSKIYKVVQYNVSYPSKNKTYPGLGKRFKMLTIFPLILEKVGGREIHCHYNKTLSLPSEVYKTPRLPPNVSYSALL